MADREHERGDEVEEEAVESGQAEDASRRPRQRRHRRPAVVQDGGVVTDGHLAVRYRL